MIDWSYTFDEQLKAMSDPELLEAYDSCSGEASDAYAAEIERRGLNVQAVQISMPGADHG